MKALSLKKSKDILVKKPPPPFFLRTVVPTAHQLNINSNEISKGWLTLANWDAKRKIIFLIILVRSFCYWGKKKRMWIFSWCKPTLIHLFGKLLKSPITLIHPSVSCPFFKPSPHPRAVSPLKGTEWDSGFLTQYDLRCNKTF